MQNKDYHENVIDEPDSIKTQFICLSLMFAQTDKVFLRNTVILLKIYTMYDCLPYAILNWAGPLT